MDKLYQMNPDQVAVLLLQQWHEVSRSVDRSLAAALERVGLSESAGAALWALDPGTPPPTMRELAHTLDCDPSNASLVSAKLEHDGLVERRPHPTDGRSRVLALTKRGKQLHARLVTDVAVLTPLRHLNAEQQRQLSKLLVAMSTPR
jgi:DNA-binding MarR family transcriptional regulator